MDPLLRLPDVDALIQLINEGAFDHHLEDILAAAHGRKRERRGRRHPYGVAERLIDIQAMEDTRDEARVDMPMTIGRAPVREHVIPGRACG